jgi:hypothetical protein
MTPTTESAMSGQRAPGESPPVTEQAQEKLQAGAQTAREQAQNATQQAKERAREQVDQRSTMAGERVKTSASDARSMAEHLRSEGKDGPAKLVDQAADQAESLGSYLQQADPDRMVRDLENFARRKPWAVMAGGLLAGFAASRFVSASSASRQVSGTGQVDETRRLPTTTGGQQFAGRTPYATSGPTTDAGLGAGRETGETYGYEVADPSVGVTGRGGPT